MMGREGKGCPKADERLCSQGLCYLKSRWLDKLSPYKGQINAGSTCPGNPLVPPHRGTETTGEARRAARSSLTET